MKNSPTLNEQMGVLADEIEQFKDRHASRVDDLEARIGGLEVDRSAARYENRGNPDNALARKEATNYLRALARGEQPQMAVTIGSGTAGGNAAPTVLVDEIEAMVRRMNPITTLVNRRTSMTGQINQIVIDTALNSTWTGEGSRSETNTPTFQSVPLTDGVCYSYVKVSEESLDDIEFPLFELLRDQAAEQFAFSLGEAIISGSGTNRPTGILNGSTASPQTIVSTADGASPMRAFGSIQYVASGASSGFQNDLSGGAASPVQDPSGCIFDLFYALNPRYRNNAYWICNSNTLALIRKFRTTTGDYIFTPGLISGQDDQILGRPVLISESVPDVAANAFPLLFGDFQRCYTLVTVGPDMRLTIDSNISTPGSTLYYMRFRCAGALTNSDAVKVLKIATS